MSRDPKEIISKCDAERPFKSSCLENSKIKYIRHAYHWFELSNLVVRRKSNIYKSLMSRVSSGSTRLSLNLKGVSSES